MKQFWLKYRKYGLLIVAFYAIKAVVYISLIAWAWIHITK